MTPEQEARFIAGRSCAEQADYLREVAASRGAEVADALRRMASQAGRGVRGFFDMTGGRGEIHGSPAIGEPGA